MFRKVLAGVDGHLGGRDAVALAAQLTAGDGTLSLAHVYPVRSDPLRYNHNDYEAAQYVHARDVLDAARKEAGVPVELRWTASTSPGRGLQELAEVLGSDLLVVGSSRRGLLGRVLIGDDTRAALNGASCAVAIAPTGYCHEPAAIREVGVGYDGSPESHAALTLARLVAAEHSARLSAFQAVATPAYLYLGHLMSAAPAEAVPIPREVERARERIAGLGGVEAHSAYGDPVEELTLYSASLGLLVVGSRGYGPLGRLVYGGVAQRLARTARCPLLVLTRSARTAADDAEATVKQRRHVGRDLLDRASVRGVS